ncbi:MAG: DNA polymerase/3'-5' exonuclease PolX [Desulfocurvibacter africanus]
MAEQCFPLPVAVDAAHGLLKALQGAPGIRRVALTGSARRHMETVRSVTIVAGVGDKAKSSTTLSGLSCLAGGQGHSDDLMSRREVRLEGGLPAEIVLVPDDCFGAAMFLRTGTYVHVAAIASLAGEQGLTISEQGVFRGARRLGGAEEEDIYALVGLPYVPPELREGGEEMIEASEGELPRLIARADLRGDLHVHTNWSDGKASLEGMALKAQELGYAYLGITDHAHRVEGGWGIHERDLARQWEEIDRLNEKLDIRLLKGAEVEILADGSLGLSEAMLAKLDYTICSIHTHLDLPAEQQTTRILKAMDHPRFRVLAHPTGRLLCTQDAHGAHMGRIIVGAAERGRILEVNAKRDRLDLNGYHCDLAREVGCLLAVCTDAHSLEAMENMVWGIGQARRGRIAPGNVLNAMGLEDIARILMG